MDSDTLATRVNKRSCLNNLTLNGLDDPHVFVALRAGTSPRMEAPAASQTSVEGFAGRLGTSLGACTTLPCCEMIIA